MALPLLAMATLKGLGAYAQYKNATATNTSMQRHLKSKAKQGQYTTAQEGQIIGKVGKQAYHGAKETKSNITGNLIAGGMEGSIAGVRAKSEADKHASTQVTDAKEKLEFDEASAKNRYRDEYENWKQAEHEKKQQATADAISSAVDIGTGMITGTGDFDSPTAGFGQFRKQINEMSEGQVVMGTDSSGKQIKMIWNGSQFVPHSG